jgi:hypothetical protein
MLLHGCFELPKVRASGAIAGHLWSGTVDSAIARDYLAGRPLPVSLAAIRKGYLDAGVAPSRGELATLAAQYSPDVATLLWLETQSSLPSNRRIQDAYERELAYVRRVGIDAARPETPPDLLVLVAPGWFYESNGAETNGDLRKQRAQFDRLRIPNRLVAVEENGSVEQNARILADAIRDASKDHRLILVSASKGGPEAAQALGRELAPEEAKNVLAWLSIGGVLRGSPYADRALEPDVCWLVRLKLGDMEGAKSMQTSRASDSFERLDFPENVAIVSFIPTPLSGDISDRATLGYRLMRPHGPNDGLTLLADELVPGGSALFVPGMDHFVEDPELDLISVALFRMVFAAGVSAERR